jgi:uncharacterized protein (DUF111 family)
LKLDTRIPKTGKDSETDSDAFDFFKDSTKSSDKKTILSELTSEKLYILETNLDDINPQLFENIFEKSLKQYNALDIWIQPLQMKKNRPAFQLSILCRKNDISSLAELILKETSTLGFRIYDIYRCSMKREHKKIKIGSSVIRVKVGFLDDGFVKYHPEYDDCREAALKENKSLMEIMTEVHRSFFTS